MPSNDLLGLRLYLELDDEKILKSNVKLQVIYDFFTPSPRHGIILLLPNFTSLPFLRSAFTHTRYHPPATPFRDLATTASLLAYARFLIATWQSRRRTVSPGLESVRTF
jgi:hypothetical protein